MGGTRPVRVMGGCCVLQRVRVFRVFAVEVQLGLRTLQTQTVLIVSPPVGKTSAPAPATEHSAHAAATTHSPSPTAPAMEAGAKGPAMAACGLCGPRPEAHAPHRLCATQ